jgi:hypothetical protein
LVLGVFDPSLENMLEDEFKDRAQVIFDELFEKKDSKKHQTGYFKVEVKVQVIRFEKGPSLKIVCSSH